MRLERTLSAISALSLCRWGTRTWWHTSDSNADLNGFEPPPSTVGVVRQDGAVRRYRTDQPLITKERRALRLRHGADETTRTSTGPSLSRLPLPLGYISLVENTGLGPVRQPACKASPRTLRVPLGGGCRCRSDLPWDMSPGWAPAQPLWGDVPNSNRLGPGSQPGASTTLAYVTTSGFRPVLVVGNDPTSLVCKTRALPLSYTSLVPPPGFEPGSFRLKGVALPFELERLGTRPRNRIPLQLFIGQPPTTSELDVHGGSGLVRTDSLRGFTPALLPHELLNHGAGGPDRTGCLRLTKAARYRQRIAGMERRRGLEPRLCLLGRQADYQLSKRRME